jgi:hypothetical protein
MQRTGTTECDQRVVARIVALFDRYQSQCADHVFVDDAVDAQRRVLDRQLERVGHLLHRLGRERAIQRHVAAQFLHLGQITQHDVGVGDGRLRATLVIGGRTRIGARRLRTYAQSLGQFGHVRDRATARTDGADIDR